MEDNSDKEIINFYKKIEPYIAIAILIFLLSTCVLLYQDNILKKEISKNCGWETEKYKCYCEKDFIESMELKIKNANLNKDGVDKIVFLD